MHIFHADISINAALICFQGEKSFGKKHQDKPITHVSIFFQKKKKDVKTSTADVIRKSGWGPGSGRKTKI